MATASVAMRASGSSTPGNVGIYNNSNGSAGNLAPPPPPGHSSIGIYTSISSSSNSSASINSVPQCLKRRSTSISSSSPSSSSSSPLDCQSLQSSLKRVRLSCSPGELRLQRDVRSLSSCGWEEMISGGGGGGSTDVHSVWQHRATGSLLLQQDALRLKLQLPNGFGSMWIQIPRMYPHRPPVISRVEGDHMWFERITIQESHHVPSHLLRGTLQASSICGATVVYNQWSPIMHIGNLLDFLIQTGLTMERPDSNNTVQQRGNDDMDMATNHNNVNTTTTSMMMAQQGKIRDQQQQFMDEHKMDDGNNSYNSNNHHPFNRGGFRGTTNHNYNINTGSNMNIADTYLLNPLTCLTPNRFDVGYHHHQNRPMFSTSPRRSNAMEL